MGHITRRVRLRYADVASTLALCIALGGTAYATGILPTGSVGRRQLRPGAVSQPKLGFPLGVASTTASASTLLSPQIVCVRAPCPTVAPKLLATLSVKLTHRGILVVDAGALLREVPDTTLPASARLTVLIDGKGPRTELANDAVHAGPSNQVFGASVQTLVSGPHSIALYGEAQGPSSVAVSNVKLIATALPSLP